MNLPFEEYENNAVFSDCRKYRYALWRIWDNSKPSIMFIGLNPSSASENANDPTIRRVIAFAKKWGYGGVYMMNCFPFISTDPSVLKEFYDTPFHDVEDFENFRQLLEVSKKCKEIVFAWGNFEVVKERANSISKHFPEAKALIKNKDGSPRHPLYVSRNILPLKFNQ